MKTEWLFDNFPFISTDKITLCRIQPTDSDGVTDLVNDEENSKYNPASHIYNSYNVGEFFQSVESAFNAKKYVRLGIYNNDNLNELLGTVQIRDINTQVNSVEIGFSLRKKHRGKGTATAAVLAVTNFLFERVDVNRIQATLIADNTASAKVLERCGYTNEGTCRQGVYRDNLGVFSLTTFSMLKEEYNLVRGSSIIARSGELSIVKMSGNDYEVMAKWLSDEKVLKYYDGRDNPSDLGKVIATYQPYLADNSEVTPCIMREKGKDIGYIQFYKITEERDALKVSDYKNPYGIDLFIGEETARGRGLGPKLIRMLCTCLFNKMNADVVIADPQVWNQRSVNTFNKCGFRQVAVLTDHELHEGKMETNIIMHRTKE